MSIRFTFRLKEDRDNDLINWLQSFGEGERSCFIRNTLRKAISTHETINAISKQNYEPLDIENNASPQLNLNANPKEIRDSIEQKLDQLMNGF